MQFTFEKLPLWNEATVDEPTWDPLLVELDLSSVQPNIPKKEPPSVVLGALPPSEVTESPFGPKQEDPAILTQTTNPSQASLWMVTSKDMPSITHVSHSPSLSTVPKILEAASTFPIPQLQAPQG